MVYLYYRTVAPLLLLLPVVAGSAGGGGGGGRGVRRTGRQQQQTQQQAARDDNRSYYVSNGSGGPIEVFWVRTDTGQLHKMSQAPVLHGDTYPINSYVGHEFELHEMPSPRSGVCDKTPDQVCRRTVFRVSEAEEQRVLIDQDFEAVLSDSRIEAEEESDDLIQSCQNKYFVSPDQMNRYSETQLSRIVNSFVDCVQGGVATTLERVNEEINFQATIRKDMAKKLENYTCDDNDADSTTPIAIESWTSERDDPPVPRRVQVMHSRPSSQIHVIEDFISPEECAAMEMSAQRKLHRATVADGKGGSQLSDNRKAMQAGILVPWEKEADGDHIAQLSRRVYDYTNHVLGLGIEEFGQEDLMSIQYFGRGTNDTSPDRYTPHCDGDCTGLPFKEGNRMATMVMYCTLPEMGGHTNFANSGVHIKPRSGNGIFFSYINPKTKYMDTGFTEHSGCPVYVGEKKIVTQWIRLGVSEEEPWTSFNTRE